MPGHETPSAALDPDAVERHLPLTHLSYHVLLALTHGPLHGYGILKEIALLTGFLELETGTLYTAIRRLVDEGLIEAAPSPSSDGDARRRYYRLSALGAGVLRAESERLAALVENARRRDVFAPAQGTGR